MSRQRGEATAAAATEELRGSARSDRGAEPAGPPGPVDRERARLARAGLLRLAEPPAGALAALVASCGPLVAWDRARHGRLPAGLRRQIAARAAGRDPAALQRIAAEDLRRAADAGGRLVIPEDDEWPEATLIALSMTGKPALVEPLGLYVRGGRLPRDQRGVATVIGSRACTGYGRNTTVELAGDLAGAGCLVVSGAAFGVDAAAHQGALHAGGASSTMAVLACGIDRVYPVANRELVDRIARGGGAVVTEYPPGTTPARHRFLVRNRLIAAFGAVVVVVEAGRRSGTLNTANVAAELNRVVMAVPGPVTSALSVGCHELLQRPGVLLATGAGDVLQALGNADTAPAPAVPARPTDGLDRQVLRVYEALPARGGRTVAQIAEESGVPGRDVLGALAELELQELARRFGPSWERRPC